MNRFFSKLDLRDIKIDPEGSRFPPDADEHEGEAEEVSVGEDQPRSSLATTPEDGTEVEVEADAEVQPIASAPGNGVTHDSTFDSWNDGAPSPTVDASADGFALASDGQPDGYDRSATTTATATAALIADGELLAALGEVLKVSARSRPSAVAGAIAGVVRESGRAEVQAIGAGATNQAVKAVAIARDYLRETGIDAVCLPAFIDVTIENEDRTAIRLVVEAR